MTETNRIRMKNATDEENWDSNKEKNERPRCAMFLRQQQNREQKRRGT